MFSLINLINNKYTVQKNMLGIKSKNTVILSLMLSSMAISQLAYAKGQHDHGDMHGSIVSNSDINAIKNAIKTLLPGENIHVKQVNQSIALTGDVSTAEVAAKAEKIAEQFVGNSSKVIDFMTIKTGQQVMLRVRFGEIKRTALKGNSLKVLNTHLDYLEKNGLFKTLSEPNIVTISGEKAEFLAGGEFPIPIANKEQGGVAIEYKSYGTKIDFKPIVLAPNRIRLNIEPEVSELSTAGAVAMNGFNIPSVLSRRAKTTVELAPGESFMIAGLIKDDNKIKTHESPIISSIPIIGSFFRTSNFDREETELVIAVTPYLVDPIIGKDVKLPTDNFHTPSQLDMIFFGALSSRSGGSYIPSNNSSTENVKSSVGYIIEE